MLIVVAGLVVAVAVVGGVALLREDDAPAPAPAAAPTAIATPSPTPANQFTYQFQNGQVSGPAVAKVRQGESVTLRLTADRGTSFHVHGYREADKALTPGVPVELTFTVATAGRFEIELHNPDRPLGVIEVQPK